MITKQNDGREAITMSLGEIVDLYDIGLGNMKVGYTGLNGFHKAVGQTTMLNPFSFTDEVRQKITRNKFRLRPFVDEMLTEERGRLIREIMDDADAVMIPSEDKQRNALFQYRESQFLKVKHTVEGLHVFERSDLFRENKNPILPETEMALGPIIAGSDWREANIPKSPGEPAGGETAAE